MTTHPRASLLPPPPLLPLPRLPPLAFPAAFRPLFHPARYKVFYGGRGGAKSWAFARALLALAAAKPLRVLCAREFQSSITDSVLRLLGDQISRLGLSPWYKVSKSGIAGRNGSEFLFKGLRRNANEIKSLEGVDICWIEEAQSVSRQSWELLIPTVRKEGSELWISFNPDAPDDETYRRFVLQPPDQAVSVKVGHADNPWLPETLRQEMNYCRRTDPDAFVHIWGGEPRLRREALVFGERWQVRDFETPSDARFFHGVDWGFAKDPTVMVRCFAQGGALFVDAEAWGAGVELDELPALFGTIPTSGAWPVKADASRPETIHHLRRRGLPITAARKWPGCVEDGIAALKSFSSIVIHPRCPRTAEEFRRYAYKTDRVTGDVLPVLIDAHNHCIDALRYALDGYITGKLPMKIDPGILE